MMNIMRNDTMQDLNEQRELDEVVMGILILSMNDVRLIMN
nr:MAG TPA: hypothetical protein [Caudoviricetes sp.]